MKKVYFFLFFSLLSNIAFSQESDCDKFKIGLFRYTYKEFPDIIVTRTETTQTETSYESTEVVEGTIVWKSNCTYHFIFTKCPTPELLGKTMFVKIFDVKGKIAKGKGSVDGFQIDFNMEKLE